MFNRSEILNRLYWKQFAEGEQSKVYAHRKYPQIAIKEIPYQEYKPEEAEVYRRIESARNGHYQLTPEQEASLKYMLTPALIHTRRRLFRSNVVNLVLPRMDGNLRYFTSGQTDRLSSLTTMSMNDLTNLVEQVGTAVDTQIDALGFSQHDCHEKQILYKTYPEGDSRFYLADYGRVRLFPNQEQVYSVRNSFSLVMWRALCVNHDERFAPIKYIRKTYGKQTGDYLLQYDNKHFPVNCLEYGRGLIRLLQG
jgi:hypothetical protein